MNKLIEKAQCLFERNQPFVMATIEPKHGSVLRKNGAQMMVMIDGSICGTLGGGHFEKVVINSALSCFECRQDSRLEYDLSHADTGVMDMSCEGHLHVKLQYFKGNDLAKVLTCIHAQAEQILLIFGAGHIGQALAQQAKLLGIMTTVIDDRAEFCNPKRFPHSYCRVTETFSKMPNLTCSSNDFVVIATRGHSGDRECLKWALDTPAEYIGMIGSKRICDMTFNCLVENDGISPEQIARVYAPIGVDIGAESPEEIAVAIIAEIISIRSNLEYNKQVPAQIQGLKMPTM